MRQDQFKIPDPRFIIVVWWLVICAITTALLLRFEMKAVGVREDIPFANMLYTLTNPLVEPFYRFFPVASRFDYPVIEWAAIAAAGVVVAVGLGVHVARLLVQSRTSNMA